MSYLVLARRWRPKRFADLIGQDVVVRTLKNALSGGQLAHAYLLTGIRGVGKTTIARLMAMAVNCQTSSDGEPCGSCDACTSVMSGSNLDVQEMDAASHTGVDDIREILDGVRYPPSGLKYKVYIIDEAHMLSKNAFNALLKTLEEPPEQVLFILATTESEKLPITVRSRCQRFDLRRLGVDEIVQYLGEVLQKEGVTAESDALQAISRAADGSVRDALSLTERVLAYSGKSIALDDVQHALGLVGADLIRALAEMIFVGDAAAAVAQLRHAAERGFAARNLLQSLGELLHELSCVQVDAELAAQEVNEDQRNWLQQWSGQWDAQALDLRYQVLIHGLSDLYLVDERQGAEMIVMRLAHLHTLSKPKDGSIKAISMPQAVAKIEDQTSTSQASPLPVEPVKLDVPPEAEKVVQPERVIQVVEKKTNVPHEEPRSEISEKPHSEPDLPLHAPNEAPGLVYNNWADALEAYHQVRVGVAAMLEHVGLLEFGQKVRLSLDAHQQRAVAMPDRLAFAEWLGREVYWEAESEEGMESVAVSRAKAAETEKKRLWDNAEQDPHVQALMEKLDGRLVNVRPAGMAE